MGKIMKSQTEFHPGIKSILYIVGRDTEETPYHDTRRWVAYDQKCTDLRICHSGDNPF
jgi:hypothetical protein